MRPENLNTKIVLYSGQASDTKDALSLLGFLDGQTTNIKLISKNREIQERLNFMKKFTREEIFSLYKKYTAEIVAILPDKPISLDIYSDENTQAQDMISQAKEMHLWFQNAVIKFPITHEGILAAQWAVKLEMNITMNHCFSQEQAAAVYVATLGAKKGQVLISPRVERLDYSGANGMDLVKNIIEMYKNGDGHVGVLTTDIGTIDQFLYSISLGVDCISSPLRIIKVWAQKGMPVPQNYNYISEDLRPIAYRQIDLDKSWEAYDIAHELTQISAQESFSIWRTLL